jgi:hypothetical protein
MNPLPKLTFLLVFLLVGCSPTQATQFPEAQVTPSESVSEPVQQVTPTVLLSPKPKNTLTLPPTPTSTSTLTPLPTWTALPTLDPKKGLQTYYIWLAGNDNCRLPCWAGIIPGQTEWQEAKQILQPLTGATELEISLDGPCTFGKCNEVSWAFPFDLNNLGKVYSKVEDGKIHFMQFQVTDFTEAYLIKSLSLQRVLTLYGKPSILLFSTEPDLPGDLFLELILVYPDSQFLIRYSKHAKLSNNNVVSCGQDSVIELNILDNKEQLMSVETIANAVETNHLHVDVWHKSVEEAAGMTIDKFYETFRKTNAPCITTPIKVWMP